MSRIKCICGEQLAFTATTIAVAISKEFDIDDLGILSSIFCAIGDNLAIIAAQRAACIANSTDSKTAESANTADEEE